MKRIAAGRSIPDSLAFKAAERPDDRAEWGAVSLTQWHMELVFLQLDGLGRALQQRLGANIGGVSAQWAFPANCATLALPINVVA